VPRALVSDHELPCGASPGRDGDFRVPAETRMTIRFSIRHEPARQRGQVARETGVRTVAGAGNGRARVYERPPGRYDRDERPLPWQAFAACLGLPTGQFFRPSEYESALKVCHDCLVVSECRVLCDRMEVNETATIGVFAGETPEMRIARRGARLPRDSTSGNNPL
jgi:hypothetical protein